jgi:peptidoglycan/xylan/chitin deacetylase (PgdA/CDA1 family)
LIRVTAQRQLRRSFKFVCAGADHLTSSATGVVLLSYHRIGGRSAREIDLDPGLFDDQMAILGELGRVVTLGDALEALATSQSPEPLVVVTFDDGTADFADVALPIIARHRVPVTLYLATAFVDHGTSWPDGARSVSWAGLADACSTGLIDVGSHTHTHRLLDRLSASEVADELDRSVELISARLNRKPFDFAYPKAVAGTRAAVDAVKQRFRSAALAGTRRNVYGRFDPYRLSRSPVQASDGLRWFERKVAGGMALEGATRRVVDRIRYRRTDS